MSAATEATFSYKSAVMSYINDEVQVLPGYFRHLGIQERQKYVLLKLWGRLISYCRCDGGTTTYSKMIKELLSDAMKFVSTEKKRTLYPEEAVRVVFDSLKTDACLIAAALDVKLHLGESENNKCKSPSCCFYN